MRLLPRRAARAALVLALAAVSGGCSQFVRYTDQLSSSQSGRSSFVTVPTVLGGSAGFIVGIPADVVALPITFSVSSIQRREDPATADPVSIYLFPSFVCWRVGKLLGAPFDALEYAAYRMWLPATTLTREERARREAEYDRQSYPTYPVLPFYPTDDDRAAARAR